ncbi:MAG: TlpA family protein disulfide reductase [Deltaproteobacteria bacterium]|nr:TlpA family protein disulfide reductase [Deltaproteobacteria bacterium]
MSHLLPLCRLALLVLLAPLALTGCDPGGTYDPSTCEEGNDLGDCASDFTLLDGSDTPWTLSDHLGKVAVVEFGQMWCTQCRRAADDLAVIKEEIPSEDLQIFAIYFEDPVGDSVETSEVADYAEEHEIPFPVLADTDGSVEAVWGFSGGRPNLFVLDALGIVRYRTSGHRDSFANDVRDAISEAQEPVE